jgi:glycosyltransferase involved in cell wall biosynthesis
MSDTAAIESKPRLILISGTAARLTDFQKNGFFNRQKKLLEEYAKYFDLEYYTSDVSDYSARLGIKHRPLPLSINVYGLRHVLFWLYLVWRAPSMRAPIRVFGVATPTLPLVKRLSGQKLIAGFQWDYARVTKANYTGAKRWLADTLQVAGLKSADVVICTTERLKDIVVREYRRAAEVIPNFVDTDVFHEAHEKEDYVLYAGRLHWAKGIEYLIRAFGLLKTEIPSARLTICGSGDHAPVLERLVEQEGVEGVSFLGVVPQDRLAQLMARAKAFVLPTVNYEGHPKALIEAMACGTACVATNVPGCRDILRHGETGLLVEPKNSIDLSEALLRLHKDENLTETLGRNAHAFALAHYSIEKTFLREVQLIHRLTGQGTSAPA